jgi:uncharacterized SAM-binding protein YcdF (DUF218 family)
VRRAGDDVSDDDLADAQLLWNFHQVGHELRRCDVAVAPGCLDLAVADTAAQLWARGLFDRVVFSGALTQASRALFPKGEAEAFAARAVELGVPRSAVLREKRARNTGENMVFSARLLRDARITPQSAMLVVKPYMQRRVETTARRSWPGVEFVCASEQVAMRDYLARFPDPGVWWRCWSASCSG